MSKFDSIPVNDSMADDAPTQFTCPNAKCGNQRLWVGVEEDTYLCPRCDVEYVVRDGVLVPKAMWNIVKSEGVE